MLWSPGASPRCEKEMAFSWGCTDFSLHVGCVPAAGRASSWGSCFHKKMRLQFVLRDGGSGSKGRAWRDGEAMCLRTVPGR